MSTAQGPFPDGDHLHVGGRRDGRHAHDPAQSRRASGFKKIAALVMAAAMRRAMTKDLERLSAIVQGRAGGS